MDFFHEDLGFFLFFSNPWVFLFFSNFTITLSLTPSPLRCPCRNADLSLRGMWSALELDRSIGIRRSGLCVLVHVPLLRWIRHSDDTLRQRWMVALHSATDTPG